jgi:HSP20 family protein
MKLISRRKSGQDNVHPAETGLARLRSGIDDLFEQFFRSPFAAMPMGPRLDLAESENEVLVKAELPGVDPKEVEINVVGNVLTLRGEKSADREEKGNDYHFVERQYGTFSRSVPLPTGVDPDKVHAEFSNGVLTIRMPKHPDVKPKRIPVRTA